MLDLSFTARIGTLLVGSVRLTPICIGETPALLLGPLTVEPPFRERGVGSALIERALKDAKAAGIRLVVLVGDEPFYGKSGFKRIPKGQVKMPGPVDPARLLVAELKARRLRGVAGMIRPDWEKLSGLLAPTWPRANRPAARARSVRRRSAARRCRAPR